MTTLREERLSELRELVLRMGTLAEAILGKALRAVYERREDLANQLAADDLEIDRLDVAIDDHVLEFLAREAPLAQVLRGVVAMKMMATDLERVGDLARNIGKSAIRMAQRPAVGIPPDLEREAAGAQRLLAAALNSFASADAAAAREVIRGDDDVDDIQDRVVRNAIEAIAQHPDQVSQGVDFILIAKNLERVADHATNIAEDVVLAVESLNLKHAAKLAGGVARASGR
jgi:phosphate transport system protein